MTTPLSRMGFAHPAQGAAGDATLYSNIEAIYQAIGDALPFRWFLNLTVANGATVTLTHSLRCAFSEMQFRFYSYTGTFTPQTTELTRLTQGASGISVIANVSNPTTQVDVTNNTGGSINLATLLSHIRFAEKLNDLSDADTTGVVDGDAFVYNSGTGKWAPGASGDASFKISAVATPNATLKGGFYMLPDGRELATWDTSTYGSNLTLNLTTILGASPANATAYYLYIDLTTLGSEQTESTTGRKLYQITSSNFVLLTTSPANLDRTRYVECDIIMSATTGTVWSGSGSAFRNLAVRKHVPNIVDQTRNYLAPFFRPGNTVDTVVSGNVTDTGNRSLTSLQQWQTTLNTDISISSSTTTPLRESASYLTTGSGNSAVGAKFIESPAFQLDTVDLSKAVSILFDLSGSTLGTDWDICVVRYNSSGTFQEKISVAGTASTGTPASAQLPTGTTSFRGFFVASSTKTDYYALRFRRLANAVNIELDSLFVGPGSYMAGYAGTDFTAYTVAISSTGTTPVKGTIVQDTAVWRRVGDCMDIHWGYQQNAGGTAGSGTYYFSLPTGYTIDSTKIADTSTFDNPLGTATLTVGGTEYNGYVYWNSASNTRLRMSLYGAATSTIAWNASNASFATADVRIAVNCRVPIAQWTSNVQVADRSVEEYAYNTSTTDANDTTSFGNGTAGGQFGAFTTERTKRVRFTTPILPTDKIYLEYSDNSGITWIDAAICSANIGPYQTQNTNTYGWYLFAQNSTDINVGFGHYSIPTGATFGSAGQVWSAYTGSAFRWRVRKVAGGGVVGYPVQSSNIVGRLDAVLPATGYVGQTISKVVATPVNAPASAAFGDIGSIVLPVGTWMVWGQAAVQKNGASFSSMAFQVGITTTTGNSSADFANTINAPDFEFGTSIASTWTQIAHSIAPIIMKNDGTTISRQTDTGTFIAYTAGQTLYLKAYVDTYSSGTPKVLGFITALRIA